MTLISFEPLRSQLLRRHAEPVALGARLRCAPDQTAVFLQWGRVAGELGPGEHLLEPQQVPFLSLLVDGGRLGGELWVVSSGGASLPVSVTPELELWVKVRVADTFGLFNALAGIGEPASLDRFVIDQLRQALGPSFAGKGPQELADPGVRSRLAEPALGPARQKLSELKLELVGLDGDPGAASPKSGTQAMPAADAAAILAASAAVQLPAPSKPAFGPGSRARMSHAGSWHSGSVVQLAEGQCEIEWDSGQKSWVPLSGLEPEPVYPGAHPPGTRVLVQWTDGGSYPATVRHFNGTNYQIAWDNGATSWLAPGQLRLHG
jgi:hypothetical protein